MSKYLLFELRALGLLCCNLFFLLCAFALSLKLMFVYIIPFSFSFFVWVKWLGMQFCYTCVVGFVQESQDNNKAYAAMFAPFWNEIIKSLREEDFISNRYVIEICFLTTCYRIYFSALSMFFNFF